MRPAGQSAGNAAIVPAAIALIALIAEKFALVRTCDRAERDVAVDSLSTTMSCGAIASQQRIAVTRFRVCASLRQLMTMTANFIGGRDCATGPWLIEAGVGPATI